MQAKKTETNNSNLEQSLIAAIRNQDFENSGLKDTKENRDSFRILKAESQRLMKLGYDVNVPF
jgi:hypothetical protein